MQKQLKLLRSFYQEHNRLPSYQEMLGLFGYRSKNSVYRLVQKLKNQGYLKKDSKGKLAPEERLFGVRLLGDVQAGFPSPAEEELADAISLDEYLITDKQSTFLLKVSGRSMTGAGINPGDLVLVERGREPRQNDIVVACVDNEWTIKRYIKRGRKIILKPENPRFRPIFPRQDLTFGGVVIGVIRKYK